MMHTKTWYRATLLAASFLVAGAGGTALGDETSASVTILRGTPPWCISSRKGRKRFR